MNIMLFDYSKLKGRIIEKFDTMAAFAEFLGVTPSMVTSKITSGSPFNTDTMVRWAQALEIESTEYGAYFCCPKS